jgi:hypothetical protein
MLHDDYPPPSLIDRVFAAIITPIVFHFSMLITVAFWLSFMPRPMANRSALVISQILINYLSRIPSEIFLVIGILLPAGAGFVLGLNKLGDYLLIFFHLAIPMSAPITTKPCWPGL